MFVRLILLTILLFSLTSSCNESAAQQNRKPLLVHYMPWFQSKPVSGYWGWHWHMGVHDLDKAEGGVPSIASHYQPAVGPYDSSDPDLIEYHLHLIRLAGFDGIVIDWYGIKDHHDYQLIHKASQKLVDATSNFQLDFCVCYEDRTLEQLVAGNKLQPKEVVPHADEVISWLKGDWLSRENYFKIKQRPALLVFGPTYLNSEQFQQIFTPHSANLLVMTLPHLAKSNHAPGAFGWVPTHDGKTISPEEWKQYIAGVAQQAGKDRPTISTAFPGFHDYYKQANQTSYGFIDHRDGQTLIESLKASEKTNSVAIQIATWNDFGEGTMIEPTKEFGYRYLEIIQDHRQSTDPQFQFNNRDLRLPEFLYRLRKSAGQTQSDALNRASKLIMEGKTSEAAEQLSSIAGKLAAQEADPKK